MEIRILGSGSSGNAYWVSDGNTPLLLECGLPIRKIREGVDFKLSTVAGCLVSHEHGDHAKSVTELMKAGVDVYASHDTHVVLGTNGHHRALDLLPGAALLLGTWKVQAFAVEHDAVDPCGFVLDSMLTHERLVYSGDTGYIRNRFAGMTHVLVECNNTWDAVREGSAPRSLKERVVKTHMSLDTVKGFLAANDLSRVREIWLLHLSDAHSDAERFRREIQELTGKEVRVA
jgi:phosphoribosyl 1,2-cyclic phosphodiesterase